MVNLANIKSVVEVADKLPNNMMRKVLQELAYEKSIQDEPGIRNPCKHLETVFSNATFGRKA